MTFQAIGYGDSVPASRAAQDPLHVWWQYMRAPLAVFGVLAALFAATPADVDIAHALFFDARHGWLGAGSWWTNDFLHTAGQWWIRVLVLAALGFWLATFRAAGLRALRRPAAYAIVAFLLSVTVVGFLKWATNVHCPWDLIDFGGVHPYVHLFSQRSALLPRGQCFPAGHASSGYALVALYFVLVERHPRAAKAAMLGAALVGLTFGLGQQSRGAHFMSHDVWSAFIAWTVCVSVYVFGFRCRLWKRSRERLDATSSAAADAAAPRARA
jgi:membrane-associated PAP2 superfamily phosphatase